MANLPYQNAYDKQAADGLNWETGSFLVVALDLAAGGYVFDASDRFRDDLSGQIDNTAVTGMDTAPHPTGGIVGDLTDVNGGSGLLIPTGSELTALVVCTNTGVEATDELLFYWDTDPDGNPISRLGDDTIAPIIWSNGYDRVWSITRVP